MKIKLSLSDIEPGDILVKLVPRVETTHVKVLKILRDKKTNTEMVEIEYPNGTIAVVRLDSCGSEGRFDHGYREV